MNDKEYIAAFMNFGMHLTSVVAICFLIEIGSIWGTIAVLILALVPLAYKIWKESK